MNFRVTTLFLIIFINNSYFSQANASFNADIISGCSPLVVNFTNTSTNSISHTWDFGNGTTAILNNPSATFVNPGFYTVKLVAYGATNSDSIISIDYIHVFDKPMASLTYNIITNCESDNIIDFTNSSTGATSYIWDFGNGFLEII
jgi:PKD repeat protein